MPNYLAMSESPSASKSPLLPSGSNPDALRGLLLQTYESVLTDCSAIYCSAPITSGQLYIEWLTRSDGPRHVIDELSARDRDLHRAQVIEPNRAHAREIVHRLRERMRKPVIDPTVVGPISSWRQPDWIGFWEAVIGRFVSEVVFVEGWEFSSGCTHEFWFATTKGIPTLDETGKPLPAFRAAQQIAAALPRLREAGIDATKFDRILDSLRGVTR